MACQGPYSTAQWVRLEPATSRSPVRRSTTGLPSHAHKKLTGNPLANTCCSIVKTFAFHAAMTGSGTQAALTAGHPKTESNLTQPCLPVSLLQESYIYSMWLNSLVVERRTFNREVPGSSLSHFLLPWASCSRTPASVTKQYHLVLVKGRWCSASRKITGGQVESNVSPPLGIWLTSLAYVDQDRLGPNACSSACDYIYVFSDSCVTSGCCKFKSE